LVERYCS
jgi:hypothetical protein